MKKITPQSEILGGNGSARSFEIQSTEANGAIPAYGNWGVVAILAEVP